MFPVAFSSDSEAEADAEEATTSRSTKRVDVEEPPGGGLRRSRRSAALQAEKLLQSVRRAQKRGSASESDEDEGEREEEQEREQQVEQIDDGQDPGQLLSPCALMIDS